MLEMADRPRRTNGPSRMTIREIADLAGVSIATVSRVLNGRDDVADETRELVRRVVQEHGYTANRSARGLSAGRTGLVGVLVPLVYPVYFSAILAGAAGGAVRAGHAGRALADRARARPRGVAARPADARRDRRRADRPAGGVERRARARCSTTGTASSSSIRSCRSTTASRRFPPRTSPAPTRRCATCSALGHRRIAAITGPRGWVATEERRRGYHAALASAGILPDPALEVESDFEICGGVKAAAQLLDLADPPTAIFAFNDNIAIGAIQAARARGLRVPGGPLGRRLRRRRARDDRDAAADDRPAAARGDGPHGGEPARAPARAAALRDAPRRARHAPRGARVDGPAADAEPRVTPHTLRPGKRTPP